jgi:methyltransferase
VGPSWVASGVVLFAASKWLKYWAIRSLGVAWTFRVFVVPGRPLVTSGPYRYVAHPNYIAVIGEFVGAAMMFRAATSGPVMCALFGVALWARVRFETRVLRSLSAGRAREAS